MHAHVHHVCNALGAHYQHAMAVAHAPSVLQGGCMQCIMLHDHRVRCMLWQQRLQCLPSKVTAFTARA